MLSLIWGKFSGYFITAGAIIAAVLGIYLKGKSDGKANEQIKSYKDNAEANKKALKNSNNVNTASDDAVTDELLNYKRD